MKITNKAGLPDALVQAIQNDNYDRGDADYTVTELLQPPRAFSIIRAHADEIEEDASDRIFALLGQIGHLILERAADPRYSENRFYGDFLGKKISGRADLFENWIPAHMTVNDEGEKSFTLWDYKYTSLWVVKDGVKPEWEAQINMLALLADMNERHVENGNIVAIYRDWFKTKASTDRSYPQQQVQVFPIRMWDTHETKDYIEERIRLHEATRVKLPLCTPEERWLDNDVFALKKRGAKRAIRLFDDIGQATAAAGADGQYFVEPRKGVPKRCVNYCGAAPFCEQYQSEIREEMF